MKHARERGELWNGRSGSVFAVPEKRGGVLQWVSWKRVYSSSGDVLRNRQKGTNQGNTTLFSSLQSQQCSSPQPAPLYA